jgi:hypothetical protein
VKLEFQETVEEGGRTTRGGEIRKKGRRMCCKWAYILDLVYHGTAILAQHYLGDQIMNTEKCIQNFGEKARKRCHLENRHRRKENVKMDVK